MARKPPVKPVDPTEAIQEFAAAFRIDTEAMQAAARTSAGYADRLAKVAISAAQESNEVSSKWTRETLERIGSMGDVKDNPQEIAKVFGAFAAVQNDLATQQMSAFAEIAKRVQMETIEILMAAGKTASEETVSAMRKASGGVAGAARKSKDDD